ncbi:MAG: tetratricopeptide repeat protein, partial [Ignavibacteriales bacterium]|nr:tetratricopeptide repeat protein [Ignavibacteriales bacterium]
QSMGLTGYPSTGFLDSKGQLINLITGYKTLSEFRKLLDFFISGKYQTVDYNNFTFIIHFENELSKAPDNTDLQFILGYVYHKIMNDYNLASEFYNKALKDNSLQALIYVSLSELEAKNGNKEKALEYYKIALDNGFNNFDEVNQKISEIAKKYSPKQ